MSHSTNSYGIAVQKNIFTSKKIVEMAMNSEIINYNDGFLSINHVFESLGFPGERYFFSMLIKKMMSA